MNLNYQFKDALLLKRALMHSSMNSDHSNERLEFLGDSVLGLIVSNWLFVKYPLENEGYLTKAKCLLISRKTCTQYAIKLGLQKHLLLGKGIKIIPDSILANVFESLLGAIFLDGGLEAATAFVIELLDSQNLKDKDYKSRIQEIAQNNGWTTQYEIIEESGPDHNKSFIAAILINGRRQNIGFGKTKKEAEQAAAENFLNRH